MEQIIGRKMLSGTIIAAVQRERDDPRRFVIIADASANLVVANLLVRKDGTVPDEWDVGHYVADMPRALEVLTERLLKTGYGD